MPLWLLTNPISLLIYFIIIEVVLKIISLVMRRQLGFAFKKRFLVYVLIILVLTAMQYNTLFSDDRRQSMVNVSPIADLSYEQINRLESVLEMFREYDFIRQLDIEEKATHPYLTKSCDMIWLNTELKTVLFIGIFFYKDEQGAIESMQRMSKIDINAYYANDNTTEILLFDSRMARAGHGVPVPTRYLRSELRFGNATISLRESLEPKHLHMNTSSDFVELLCEMLTQEHE